jgi:hypothetical protein
MIRSLLYAVQRTNLYQWRRFLFLADLFVEVQIVTVLHFLILSPNPTGAASLGSHKLQTGTAFGRQSQAKKPHIAGAFS